MHFFDRYLEEHYPERLLYGGVFSSLVLIASGVLSACLYVIVFAPAVDWIDVGLALASIGASGALVLIMVTTFRRHRTLGAIPTLALLATVLATFAIGFVGIAADGGTLVVALLVLPAVAVGLFGDLSGLVLQWVAATATVAWSLRAQGVADLAPAVVVMAIVLAGAEMSIALVMRFLARNMRFIEMFRDFDRLVDETMTHAEALEACFEQMAPTGSTTHAVVLEGVPELGFRVMLDWPSNATVGARRVEMTTDPDVAEVARSGVPLVRDDYALLPIGYTDAGAVVAATKRSAGSAFATVNEIPYDILTAALTRVSMRVSSFQRLQALSNTDPLTGLFNRRALLERLTLEIEHAERDDTPLSIAMVDLDHFKGFNDALGHLAGDELLRAVASIFRQRLRRADTPARYGGEEFCLVLPDVDAAAATRLLDELRGTVNQLDRFGQAVTFSAGVAGYRHGEQLVELIDRADQALYEAKDRGRNQVLGADPVTTPVRLS